MVLPTPDKNDQVFLSYSTTPPENVEFVRGLAHSLRRAGFNIWLDEEQLTGADDFTHRIDSAIDCCNGALLIITQEWIEKNWTRYEGELLAKRKKRILKIHRDRIEPEELGPHLFRFQHVEWIAGDPDPDARLWQVYCGLKGVQPGERRQWSVRGQAVTRGSAPEARMSAVDKPRFEARAALCLAAPAAPVLARLTHHEAYVLVDDDRWFRIPRNESNLQAVAKPSGPVSDAAIDGDALVVSLYQPMIARLVDECWEYDALTAPVLKMLSTEMGLVLGDQAGNLTLRFGGEKPVSIHIGEPILDLQEYDGGLVVLGGRGGLSRVQWNDGGTPTPAAIATGSLGMPVELFATGSSARIGVIGRQHVGIISATNDWSLKCSPAIDDGIESVAMLGSRSLLAVLGDSGAVWIVDLAQGSLHRVSIPGDATAIRALAPISQRSVSALSTGGELYQIHADGTVRALPYRGVQGVFATGRSEGMALVDRDGSFEAQWIKVDG